jgi:hypothetical protein
VPVECTIGRRPGIDLSPEKWLRRNKSNRPRN